MCINPKKINHIYTGEEITIPCGKCILCRKKRSQNWAIRLIKEGLYHTNMTMLTLTFDSKKLEENPDADESWAHDLNKSLIHFQKFMKRFRKYFKEKSISYFKVGEYGEKRKRAHYHVLIYGIKKEDFKDVKPWEMSKSNKMTYISDKLNKLWQLGICTISDVNNATIKYVANYTLKKIRTGETKNNNEYYKPKMSFSNKNKIGIKWLRKHHKDIRKGYVIDSDGIKYGIPKRWKFELKRWEEQIDDIGYNNEMYKTAMILENYYNELFEKMPKAIEMENLKKKAEKLEYLIKLKIRDTL